MCLGFTEEVAFSLSLEGWAGVHFAMRMTDSRNRDILFELRFRLLSGVSRRLEVDPDPRGPWMLR